MRIPEFYSREGFTLSLELFPPKSDEAEEALFRDTLPALRRLNPRFFSVTYGAGGSTRGLISSIVLTPVSAMLTSSSSRRMSIALATPTSPPAPSPKI